jgi:hypothetical protein
MKRLSEWGLFLAAAFLGGLISHYAWTQPVQAQAQPPVPKEIRAQSFVLVNDQGVVQGVIAVGRSQNGRPSLKLYDGNGRELWSFGGNEVRPLSTTVGTK